jgi:hypothetical protein
VNIPRHLKAVWAIGTIMMLLTSCEAERGFAPASSVAIKTDSAVYHLQSMDGGVWYQINLTVTVVNDSNRDVFIGRDCGDWRLARADETDKTDLILGSYACIESPRQEPLHIAPGEQFSRSFRLTGSNSELTRPPITIENNSGTLVLSFVFTDPLGNQIGRVNSAAFRVEPPV